MNTAAIFGGKSPGTVPSIPLLFFKGKVPGARGFLFSCYCYRILGGKYAVQEITAAVFRRGKSRYGTFNIAAIFRGESPGGGALFTATVFLEGGESLSMVLLMSDTTVSRYI